MRKRLFAFLLTFCLLLPAWSEFSVLALDSAVSEDLNAPVTEEPALSDNIFNKIHFYFGSEENAFIDDMTELQSATAAVKNDYAATAAMMARSGEPADENVYITVQFASDYLSDKTYLTLKATRDEAKSAEARDVAKSRQNAYSKSYHAAIVEDNLPLLADIPYTNANPIDYSSFVTLTVPADDLDTAVLAEIAESDEILHISLTDGFEVVSTEATTTSTNVLKTDWDDVLECIGAKSIVENKTYTGEGIKVGIYEFDITKIKMATGTETTTDNVCDITHPNLNPLITNNLLHFRTGDEGINGAVYGVQTHATMVISILAKMLPDAEFYFANTPSTTTGTVLEGIEWLIDQGCDVVNCSFGYDQDVQYRYDVDAVYDYQIGANNIIVVAATGNSAEKYVGSPAQAYNVIAVGGVKNDAVSNNWISEANVSYINQSGMVKPNISAPYKMKVENIGEIYGTSFAAPLVTACIAILQEFVIANVSSAMLSVENVMSIVMATAEKTADYTAIDSQYECADDRVGAGIINLTKMLGLANSTIVNDNGSGSTMVYRKNITLSAGDEICIAAAWLAEATPVSIGQVGGNVNISNYNLYLNTSAGAVAASIFTSNNVEYIRYTVPNGISNQTYYITLVRIGAVNTQIPIGVAYYYH